MWGDLLGKEIQQEMEEPRSISKWWIFGPILIICIFFSYKVGYSYGYYSGGLSQTKTHVTTNAPISPVSSSTKLDLKNITEGEYKVGEEIPAGEYKIIAAPDCLVLYHVYKFVNGNKQRGDSGNTTGKEYVKVKSGEILHIGSGGHAELLTESN